MWNTFIHLNSKPGLEKKEKRKSVGGVTNSVAVAASARCTWWGERRSTTWQIRNIQAAFYPGLWLHPGSLRPSHTQVRHVKQLITLKYPFQVRLLVSGLPVVLKRLVSSHVSFAQAPPLPTHKVINGTWYTPIQIKRERNCVLFFPFALIDPFSSQSVLDELQWREKAPNRETWQTQSTALMSYGKHAQSFNP